VSRICVGRGGGAHRGTIAQRDNCWTHRPLSQLSGAESTWCNELKVLRVTLSGAESTWCNEPMVLRVTKLHEVEDNKNATEDKLREFSLGPDMVTP
jgi:hypothetical protein